MITVKWTDKVKNYELLTRVGEEIKLLKVIRKTITSCLGYIEYTLSASKDNRGEKVESRRKRGKNKGWNSLMTSETEAVVDLLEVRTGPREMERIQLP